MNANHDGPTNLDRQAKKIFDQALELNSDKEIKAFLNRACSDNQPLKDRVLVLLASHRADSFLEKPAAHLLTTTALIPVDDGAGEIIGRYKLLQKIGEGGCGVVYMAEQQEPVRRKVALKIIKLSMDTKSVIARFEAERQALALMDHPNIAKVYDGGSTGDAQSPIANPKSQIPEGRPYFVMELVRGVKITDYCDQANLTPRERLDLFMRVCHAVQHAHQKGIIHRDLKPSNILVTINDGVAVPKVIDFGIAKATTDQRLTDKTLFTAFEQFIGTPAYMSPEQALMTSLDIDTRSDIYSLGVLLYEMLTGQPPFPADRLLKSGLDEMRRIIREEEPDKPSTRLTQRLNATANSVHPTRSQFKNLKSKIPSDLDWIVMKALEKDRSRRYATAQDFAQDVQRHLKDEAVLARPPSALYRFQRTYRRNRLAFSAAGCVLVSMIIAMAFMNMAAKREGLARVHESIQRNFAEQQRQQAALERDRALRAESNATLQATFATNALQSANEHMVKLNVAEGWRRVEEGDHFGALIPFAEAFALEEDQPEKAEIHQMRLASVLQQCPKLVNVWSVGTHNRAEFNKDGSRLLTIGPYEGKYSATIWDSVTGQPLSAVMPHRGRINHIQWSDDESKILTASEDKSARVWDARTGRPVTPPLEMNSPVIWADFDSSGTRLVTVAWREPTRDEVEGDSKGRLAVWDMTTGQNIWIAEAPLQEIQDFVLFTPGDEYVITPSEVRNASDGSILKKLSIYPHPLKRGQTASWELNWPVNSQRVAFSQDGSRLFIAPSRVRSYYNRHKELRATLLYCDTFDQEAIPTIGLEGLRLAKFNGDGRRLTTADDGFSVRIWDVITGAALTSPMRHAGSISSLTFSQDGRKLASTTANGYARIWNVDNGEPSSPQLPHGSPLVRASFSADDHQLHVFGSDGIVRTWDLRSASVPRFSWRGGIATDISLNSDSNIVLSTPQDFPIVFSIGNGEPILPPFRPPDDNATEGTYWKFSVASDGKSLLGPLRISEVSVSWARWNTETGETFTNHVDTAGIWSVYGFSSDRRFMSNKRSGDRENFVVREVSSNRVVFDEPLAAFSFSADSSRGIGLKLDGTIKVWRLDSSLPALEFGDVAPERYSRDYSDDGSRFLSYGEGHYELWNTDSGERLATFKEDHGCLSREGKWLATAKGRRVSIYSVTNQSTEMAVFLTRMDADWGMEFSPDSRLLFIPNPLGGIEVKSVPSGELVVVHNHSKGPVRFGPDSRSLLVSQEGGVQFWPLLGVRHNAQDWLTIARLCADERAETASNTNQNEATDWRRLFQTQHSAFTISDEDIDGWERHQALRYESAMDWSSTVVHLSRLLETHPGSGDFLSRRAEAYVWWARDTATNSSFATQAVTNLLEMALADYNRALAWVERFPAASRESRKVFLQPRSQVLHKLGRFQEAQADLAEVKGFKGFTPRSVDAGNHLIDLSPYYTEELSRNDPKGVQVLSTGVLYDLRGSIGLGYDWEDVNHLNWSPIEVKGIRINRSARRIHFLHQAGLNNEASGTAARLVIHMTNGTTHTIELRAGEDFWYGESKTGESAPTRASRLAIEIPWHGESNAHEIERWFERSWQNPTPDIAIDSVDFIAVQKAEWPTLYAITVEP